MNEEEKKPSTNGDASAYGDALVSESEVGGGVDESGEKPLSEGGAAAEEGDDAEPKGKETEKPKQSKAENAEFARRRREAEARAKAEKEAKEREEREKEYRKGKIDALKTNPYTGDAIEDDFDLEQYELMKELDDEGKDPVRSYPKAYADKIKAERLESERKSKESAEASARMQKGIDGEVDELRRSYPDLDTAELARNPNFQKFANGKYGRWTLKEIYEGYLEEGLRQARIAKADRKASTPSSASKGVKASKSFADMSDEEFLAYRKERFGH